MVLKRVLYPAAVIDYDASSRLKINKGLHNYIGVHGFYVTFIRILVRKIYQISVGKSKISLLCVLWMFEGSLPLDLTRDLA